MQDDQKNIDIFPRKLSRTERQLLFSVLPENKPGYASYRKLIEDLFVVGFGRFGEGNFILGKENDLPDLSAPSSNIFAVGNCNCKYGNIYIVIHEMFEDKIEIQFSKSFVEKIPDDIDVQSSWTYSTWIPGFPHPGDKSKVREIQIIKNNVVLAISTKHKRIWVYEKKSGVNHFIPVTKLYDEIMRIEEEKDPKIALDSSRFFSHNSGLSDQLIGQGFLVYNKYWKKVEVDKLYFEEKQKTKTKGFIRKIFKV